MQNYAIQSLSLIITAGLLIVGLPLALKLLFAVGPVGFILIVVGGLLVAATR
jgi:hypothetical protein